MNDLVMAQNEPALIAGETRTQGFDSTAIARVAETASSALAEQAKATIQARYIAAWQRPRDMMLARQTILDDCKRPGFAKVAIYRKPVGKGVEGPSIRMAEACIRAMGNVSVETQVLFDDPQKRVMRVTVTELERNSPWSLEITIEKTIERKSPMPGRKILMMRKNSEGGDVFVLEAIADEILDKVASAVSKAIRTCALRVVPGDIMEEAVEQCYRTRRGEISRNPAEAIKRMVDAFQGIGVLAKHLAEYLGHEIDSATVEEIDALRSVYTTIKDGETTWAEALDAAKSDRGPAPSDPTVTPKDVKDRLEKKAAEKSVAAQPKPADNPKPSDDSEWADAPTGTP